MSSSDLDEILSNNENKTAPGYKLSRKRRYVLGTSANNKYLYSPVNSWIRFQYAQKHVEYHSLQNIKSGKKSEQPSGAFGCVKLSNHSLRYIDGKCHQVNKTLAIKIEERDVYHCSRDFEIQLQHEWTCLSEIYGVLPKPTFITDDLGRVNKGYLSMPYFSGMSLLEYKIKSINNMTLETINTIIINMLHQIKYVHAKGMIHCDIKLDNFIIHPDSLAVHLVDYGNAYLSQKKEDQFKTTHGIHNRSGSIDYARSRGWDLYYFSESVRELIADYPQSLAANDYFIKLLNILAPFDSYDRDRPLDLPNTILQLENCLPSLQRNNSWSLG
jgi:serine/threonine protein kinase